MLEKLLNWLRSFFKRPEPAPPPADPDEVSYKAMWARRGYKDEQEYLDYVRSSLKLTENHVKLIPNHVYKGDPGEPMSMHSRYLPGLEDAEEDGIFDIHGREVQSDGTWNETDQYPGIVINRAEVDRTSNHSIILAALARALSRKESTNVNQ